MPTDPPPVNKVCDKELPCSVRDLQALELRSSASPSTLAPSVRLSRSPALHRLTLTHRICFPIKDNSDEEDVLFTPPDIPALGSTSDGLSTLDSSLVTASRIRTFFPPRNLEEQDCLNSSSLPFADRRNRGRDFRLAGKENSNKMAHGQTPRMKGATSFVSLTGTPPPLPISTPPQLPSAIATPYLETTPMKSGVGREENDENSVTVSGVASANSSNCQGIAAAAYLPSTPSTIPLIDESPNIDADKKNFAKSCANVTTEDKPRFVNPIPPPRRHKIAETPSLHHIRSSNAASARSKAMPLIAGASSSRLSHGDGRRRQSVDVLPTPFTASNSAALSSSFLSSTTQKSASLNKFRYTALWNGAVAALRENVAVKRRKRGGFGLLSSTAGSVEIFSGQDATNVLLKYLTEKKEEMDKAIDRSKAVKLGQHLLNNGYYKPVKKSGSIRSRETKPIFEDHASKFFVFCDKNTTLKTTTSLADTRLKRLDDDDEGGQLEGRRNSMRTRKARMRHPSDPGTPHKRGSNVIRKRTSNGNLLNIGRLDLRAVDGGVADDDDPESYVTPNQSPSKEVGGVVNPAFSTASTGSVPEEVKEIFGPLKSVQDSFQRVSTSASKFSRHVFSSSSLRGDAAFDAGDSVEDESNSNRVNINFFGNNPKALHPKNNKAGGHNPFGLRSSFGRGNSSATDNFRAPSRLRRVFSQNDLRQNSSGSALDDDGLALVTPAVEAELVREAALSRLFSLVDLNILDDVISAVDELCASDSSAVSEGLVVPPMLDEEERHEILTRWTSSGSLFPHPKQEEAKGSESVYHRWLVASSSLLEVLPPPSPDYYKQNGGGSFTNVAFDVESLDERCIRLFQTTTDAVLSHSAAACSGVSAKKRPLPALLPPSLNPIYAAISELLCLGREAESLLASRLLILLVPSERRNVLLRLLLFMNVAVFNSSVRLLIGKSNATHVLDTFAPVIFGKKHATHIPEWKSFLGHLVRHSKELAEIPQEIKEEVEEKIRRKVNMISLRPSRADPSLRRSARFRRSAVQYCKTIEEETYEEQKVTETTDALRSLYLSIKNDPSMTRETRERYLHQMHISHPNLFVTQL